jgi:polyribonucleotide nucleotidyltransferase
MTQQMEIEAYGKDYLFEVSKFAKQADGAVMVRSGDTMVLVTVVGAEEPREGTSFFPLTVDVEERMYAAGKIPGGFIKREGRPSEKSILTARLIDRPLRPSFPDNFRNEIQVIATVLSVDLINPPDILAMLGASAALSISGLPFQGPIAALRIGRVGDRWIVNPTFQELEHSDMDVIVAGTRDHVLTVEAGAREIPESDILAALRVAQESFGPFIDVQERLKKEFGKPAREVTVTVPVEPTIEEQIRAAAADKLAQALKSADKLQRAQAVDDIKEEVLESMLTLYEGKEVDIARILSKIEKEEVRRMILAEGVRPDGRRPEEIRPISIDVGVLPRTHGSGLFTRGQTQVLSVATLGAVGEEQRLDGLGAEESKRFLHHYNFPPYSVGEIGFMRGPKRRDIGHGALVERALIPILPPEEQFPYTIRMVSEVLESNGSSSMASVCGSTLALMDAGVPIKAPVVGIAMGCVKQDDRVVILTDILGIEDALGDMDFKIAGTKQGVTAVQMDIKGKIDLDIVKNALEQAREARFFILGKMMEVIAQPRAELSEYAPRIITIKVKTDKIREVIGPGGRVIRGIIDETGATIDIEDDGTIFIASKDKLAGEKAQQMIEQIVKEVQVGDKYLGKVTKLMNFGAFVEILPGKEGLVHISKLAPFRVERVEDVVKVGDELLVEVVEIDKMDRINLAAVGAEVHERPSRPDKFRRRPR